MNFHNILYSLEYFLLVDKFSKWRIITLLIRKSYIKIGVILMINFKEGNNKFYLGEDEDNMTAVITYLNKDNDTIVIDHTFVSKELRGKNIGQLLVEKVVNFARENNKKVITQCWFAEKEFEQNKDYQDLWSK